MKLESAQVKQLHRFVLTQNSTFQHRDASDRTVGSQRQHASQFVISLDQVRRDEQATTLGADREQRQRFLEALFGGIVQHDHVPASRHQFTQHQHVRASRTGK